MRQIDEVKSLLMRKIDARFRELSNDVSKTVRQKRKAVEGRKSILDRFLVQADYALAFFDHNLMFCDDSRAFLTAKRTADRQLRYLGKADASTGINPNSRDFAMDLYFQRYTGRNMHGSLDSVIAQTLSDIKFLSEPPPPPPPPVAAPVVTVQSGPQAAMVEARAAGVPQRQRPPMSALPRASPQTPVKRGGPPSLRGSPARGSPRGGASVRGSPRGAPARGAMASRGRGSVMASARGRISLTPARGGRAASRGAVRGRGAVQPARGAPRGRGAAPGVRGASATRSVSASRGGGVARGRGASAPAARGRGVAAASISARGRGGIKATVSPVPPGAGRGAPIQQKSSSLASVQRNPGITITPSSNQPQAAPRQPPQQQQQTQQRPANQNPYFLAAYGNPEQKAALQQPPQQQQQQQAPRIPPNADAAVRQQQEAAARQRQLMEYQRRKELEMQQQQQQRAMIQQRQQQQQQQQIPSHIPPGVTIQPQPAGQNFPPTQQQQARPEQPASSSTSSWHTPQLGSAIKITPAGQSPASTPTRSAGDSSFKITLPRMRADPLAQQQQQQGQKGDKDLNTSSESVDDDGAPKAPKPSEAKSQEKPKKNRPLDLTALLDDQTTTGSPAEWLEEGIQERVSLNSCF